MRTRAPARTVDAATGLTCSCVKTPGTCTVTVSATNSAATATQTLTMKEVQEAMHPARPHTGDATAPTPPQVALPDRGIHDTAPAESWTDGFLTGNGEYGAVVYGDPA